MAGIGLEVKEEFPLEEAVVKVADQAKERVLCELSELLDKIANLTKFLYGAKILEAGLSEHMKGSLHVQLDTMTEYAEVLQYRLKIWGKSDAEIDREEEWEPVEEAEKQSEAKVD